MNKQILGIAAIGFAVIASATSAQQIPSKKKIFADMELANSYFMKKWPDAGDSVTAKNATGVPITRTSELWTRAVYYEGLMALNEVNPQKKFVDYAVEWGEKHNWSPRGSVDTKNADNQCCGQTYIDLYNLDPKPERIEKIKKCMDLVVATDKNSDWTWVDAIQMGMPIFAKLGAIYKDDPKYYEKMYTMYNHTKTIEGGGLYNTTEHLWWRDKDFVPPYKEPNGANCYWSRGNGWVYAALVRVLSIIPKNAPHRNEYLQTYLEMTKAIAPLQRTDGYWNVSLKDSTHFGGKELTGTALFVYGMAWGINNGLIDKKTYQPIIVKAWNAMEKSSLHPEGFLGFVQGTGKEPKDSQPVSYTNIPDFEDYGLGCYLLAGAELSKLAKK
ncbi:MAG: glycoside hydrolase family 88 protein [Mucilaginibacter sp.]|uniref:glycoside hydrolase family 88/105 protein n=1 Tax=Mucilaginibacter sp. TaxID=1882438 RepID=UPI00326754D9